MTKESDELAIDLRAILTEMHPRRNYQHKQFDDDLMALGVLIRREFRGALARHFQPGFAEGAEPQVTVRVRSLVDSIE